jgi:hypothetical protein
MLLTAIGVKMDPTQMGAIVSAGMAIAGAIAVFMPDRRTPPPQEPPMP